MDPLFRAKTLSATANPNQLIYQALHQDYSSDFAGDCKIPSEETCGEIIVDRLLRVGHFGPLEHGQITVNFGFFPHSVMQQVRTHRGEVAGDITFDCQCLAGDTEITLTDKLGRKNRALPIKEIYERWIKGESSKNRVRNLDRKSVV